MRIGKRGVWMLVALVLLLLTLPVGWMAGDEAALSEECEKLMDRVDAALVKYLGADLRDGKKTDSQILKEVNRLSASKIQKTVDKLSAKNFSALYKETQAIEKAAKKLESDEKNKVLKRGVFADLRQAVKARKNAENSAPLEVRVSTKDAYPVMGETALSVSVKIEGGVAPYSVKAEGDIASVSPVSTKGTATLKCEPTAWGKRTLKVIVTDAAGTTSEAKLTYTAIQREKETEKTWQSAVKHVELTGVWQEDIIAIAKSQLGYRESSKDFVLDKDGNEQHYSRYGAWYGSPYSDWCGMFIAFCAEYAGIPGYPAHANVGQMAQKMQDAGVYRTDLETYLPQKGDAIFFVNPRTGRYKHVALVERVFNGVVYTIEGNVNHSVCRRSYALTDEGIIAYASMDALMQAYWQEHPEAAVDMTAPHEGTPFAAYRRQGKTSKALVVMRDEPDVNSQKVIRIEKKGTAVTVKGEMTVKGETWYAVDKGGYQGFVRGDLIRMEADETVADGMEAMGETVAAFLASWGIPPVICVEVTQSLRSGELGKTFMQEWTAR